LSAFNPNLLERPQIIAANKADLPLDETQITELKEHAAAKGWQVHLISAATNQGIEDLMRGIADILANAPETPDFEPDYETYFEPERAEEFITVEKIKTGYFRVEGAGIERLLGYTNMADERGFAFFQRFMRERGIIERLEALGIEENDTVQLYELEFDYWK
ncbi:MAG: Obg family GTPase CgtA, partial [Defluviitaleaceae bacterium]|nr:Obg family GTPase CgtA [Defluviitaleaceae bacterium]